MPEHTSIPIFQQSQTGDNRTDRCRFIGVLLQTILHVHADPANQHGVGKIQNCHRKQQIGALLQVQLHRVAAQIVGQRSQQRCTAAFLVRQRRHHFDHLRYADAGNQLGRFIVAGHTDDRVQIVGSKAGDFRRRLLLLLSILTTGPSDTVVVAVLFVIIGYSSTEQTAQFYEAGIVFEIGQLDTID